FHQGVYLKASGNLRRRELSILEAHDRRAGNDAQIMDPGEASDESFGHSVSQVVLCGVTREIFQRQHCQRPDGRLACALSTAAIDYQSDSDDCRHGDDLEQHDQALRKDFLLNSWNWRFRSSLRLRWQRLLFFRDLCRGVGETRTAVRGRNCRDRSQKPVSATGQSLHIARTLSRVTQGLAQAIDGCVDTVVNVHKGIARPKLLPELLASDNLTCVLEKNYEHLKRLILKFDLHALLAQLAGLQVGLESAKAQHARFCR